MNSRALPKINTILPQYKVMLEVSHEDAKKLFFDAGMDKNEVEVFTIIK